MWIVLVLAVAVLATVTLGPRLGLFQVETVLSGSMEPLLCGPATCSSCGPSR